MDQLVFPDRDFPGLAGNPQGLPPQTAHLGTNKSDDGLSLGTSDILAKDEERAPLSMRPKRAGRKLDTKEPESKRRAQNRAAQRAFRERKERHLRDLEVRIQELEQESATWRNSSILLRSKVSELEQQLSTRPSTASSTPIPAPQPAAPTIQHKPQNPSSHMPSPNDSNKSSNNSPPQRSRSNEVFDSFATPSSTSSITPAQAALGENPSSTEFCDELNLACVIPSATQQSGFLQNGGASVPPQTLTPASTSSTGLQASGSLKNAHATGSSKDSHATNGDISPFLNGQNQQSSSAVPNGALMPEIDLLSELQNSIPQQPLQTAPEPTQAPVPAHSKPNVESQPQSQHQGVDKSVFDFSFQDNQSFDVMSFINNDSTLFDGFDFDAVWNNDSVPMSTGAATNGSNQIAEQTLQPTKDPLKPSEVPSQKQNVPEIVPATREKYISCTEVWDRICSRPRFGEIDIQGMCMELRAKAKCSDSGVVLPERDVDQLLNSYK